MPKADPVPYPEGLDPAMIRTPDPDPPPFVGGVVTDRDQLRERIARALYPFLVPPYDDDAADAVLDALQLEQVGWLDDDELRPLVEPRRGWVPVYIVREDTAPPVCPTCKGTGLIGWEGHWDPCPRGCEPEGETP